MSLAPMTAMQHIWKQYITCIYNICFHEKTYSWIYSCLCESTMSTKVISFKDYAVNRIDINYIQNNKQCSVGNLKNTIF